MKNITLLLIFTLSITVLSAQNIDEEAIKKVITTEFDAYVQRDFKTWADTYVDAPTTTFMVTPATSSGSLFAMSDFQKISKGMKGMFDSGSKSTMSLANRDGWLIRVKGDMAFAIYNEEFLLNNGTKIKGKVQKVMEKVKGQWKIATTSAICDFNNAIIPTPHPEEEAIKKVILNETEYWMDGNYEKWSESYIHEPYLTWSVTNGGSPGDAITIRGWEAFGPPNEKNFSNRKEGFAAEMRKSKTTRDKWNIQIRGNVAYVNFKALIENEEKQSKFESTEMRVLERINGAWKIATLTAIVDFKDATPPMRSKY
jgi:ketosteroid isomerase-like protein